MNYLFHDSIGFVHLLSAITALITGTCILALKKGTQTHIRIGYIYAISMLIVNITAFMIYRLFGGFGIFHIAALVSLVTLLGGMIPALLRKPKSTWLTLHFSFMYWSVMGLYAAFASEVLTRVPESPFFGMVGIATGFIMLAAGVYFYFGKHRWGEVEA